MSQIIYPVTSAYFIMTENCNLRCRYCFEKDTRSTTKIMDEKTAFKMIDFLFDEAIKYDSKDTIHCTFFGGEPMLALDLCESMLKYGDKKRTETGKPIRFSIITNGTIYNDKVEHLLQLWYDLYGTVDIQLSIDGVPEVQNKNRPCANTNLESAKLVEEAVPKFKKFLETHGLNKDCLYIHSVVTHATIPLLWDSYRYFLGTLGVGFEFAWLIEDEWVDEDVRILDEQLSKIIPHLAQCTTNIRRFPFKRFDRCSGCGSGRALLAIDTEGNLYPCHRFYFYSLNIRSEMIFGNIHNDEPIDYNIREQFLTLDERKMSDKPCQVCVAVNYESTGDLYKRPSDFDQKFMVIINHHYAKFADMIERRSLVESVQFLTEKTNTLEKEIEKIKSVMFDILTNKNTDQ